jgi:hypothetical protein
VLNLILLLAAGGLFLEHGLHLTPTGHKIVLFLIVLVIYGSMALWVKANAAALQELDEAEYRQRSSDMTVYGTPESPTHTQAHYQEIMSFYRHESLDRRGKQ